MNDPCRGDQFEIPVRDQLPGVWRVELVSDVYGYESFDYDDKESALEGLSRLVEKAEEYEERDGVKREVHWRGFISEEEI